MDLSSLKYFIAVARIGHMTKAAEQLNISQPALSASMKRLEAEVGFRLFDRVGRGITLSEYGKMLLEAAITTENTMNDCIAAMTELYQKSYSFFRIACSVSPVNSALIEALLAKGLAFEVINIPQNWEQTILDKSCDLVITTGRPELAGIASAIVSRRRVGVMAGRRHPLAEVETVTPEDLCYHPFCSTGLPHTLSSMAHKMMAEWGFNLRVAFLCRDSADMLKAIRSGKYLGFMGEHNKAGDEELVVLPVPDLEIDLPISLYWRDSDTKHPVLSSVRQHIVDFYTGFKRN